MTSRARGPFDVKVTPQAPDSHADGTTIGRLTIDKQYRGDLDAAGTGVMLTGMTSVRGSAAYVAIERVTGTLAGRRGSFLLQHRGTMSRGAQQLEISVVPDSGTDQLAGISGAMRIDISDGKHSYHFEYALTEPA